MGAVYMGGSFLSSENALQEWNGIWITFPFNEGGPLPCYSPCKNQFSDRVFLLAGQLIHPLGS